MGKVTFDYTNTLNFIKEEQILDLQEKVGICNDMLHNKTGLGSEFLGWVDLPKNYDREEFRKIKDTAEKIRGESDVFIVVGIGGSYLGARAAIEMLNQTL